MITKMILAYLTIMFGLASCIFIIVYLIIEYIKDKKGDTMADRVKLLKDLGYEVEVENQTIFIILPKKEYNNPYFRKGIDEIMRDYEKSYGIRLKDGEDGED